jgi:carboxymethylenebutenolidase
MPHTRYLQHNITSGNIWVVVNETQSIPAFWAHPQIGGPFPGLILLHDDWGMGAHMRALVHRFAEVGYYVIAPDLFEGRRAATQYEADGLELYFKPLAPPKVTAALQALETHRKCNSKMAVLGWDLGAELAVQVALEHTDIMAAVSFYGDLSGYLDKLRDLKCPTLVIQGGADEITRRTETHLRAELQGQRHPHQLLVYPNAPHGFYNDMTAFYQADAAEDAWFKALSFLETYQGKPPAPKEVVERPFRPGRVY